MQSYGIKRNDNWMEKGKGFIKDKMVMVDLLCFFDMIWCDTMRYRNEYATPTIVRTDTVRTQYQPEVKKKNFKSNALFVVDRLTNLLRLMADQDIEAVPGCISATT
jgi:hypothetical protein